MAPIQVNEKWKERFPTRWITGFYTFLSLKLKEKASNLLCLITYKIFTIAGSVFDARLKA